MDAGGMETMLLMRAFCLMVVGTLLAMSQPAIAAVSPRDVSFSTSDGGMIDADLYGDGTQGVVFAHGAIFNKQSWAPLAKRMAALGYRALAIDFRGYGKSRGGRDPGALDLDVVAAVHWMHAQGVHSVSVVGGSMGGGAAGKAATELARGQIDRLVLLSPVPIDNPGKMHADRILFIASRHESLEPTIRQQFERAPEPRKLVTLPGSAHAQNIFATKEGPHLADIIVRFLTDREPANHH